MAEIVAVLVFLGLLAGSLDGSSSLFADIPRWIRIGGVAFLVIELVIPIWVYADIRLRDSSPGIFWVYVAAMPGINLHGLYPYLDERKREREE